MSGGRASSADGNGHGAVETQSGLLKWWRPDLLYSKLRQNEPAHKSAIWALAFLVIGPTINMAVKQNRRLSKDTTNEKQKVKRREKWRLEAREEFNNEQ